jgi:isopenicillin N synthase-like dioxygenase
VPGLEVLNQDGIWIDVPPRPGTFICNVGQCLERQSNGRFPAAVHRVRNRTGSERYSIALFLSPDPDAEIGVLDCCVGEGESPRYDKVNAGDYHVRKLLPARIKHPTSIKYKDVPPEEWTYDLLLP